VTTRTGSLENSAGQITVIIDYSLSFDLHRFRLAELTVTVTIDRLYYHVMLFTAVPTISTVAAPRYQHSIIVPNTLHRVFQNRSFKFDSNADDLC